MTRAAQLSVSALSEVVASIIRTDGKFVSKKDVTTNGGTPTSDVAIHIMQTGNSAVTQADRDLAAKALTWARQINAKTSFDFSLRDMALASTFNVGAAGIAAYIVPAYQRHLAAQVAVATQSTSQHFGAVKERMNFKAKVVAVRSFDGEFGTRYQYQLDVNGNVAVWWTGNALEQLVVGAEVELRGTVKKHDIYRGVNQTVFSRCEIHTPGVAKVRKPKVPQYATYGKTRFLVSALAV